MRLDRYLANSTGLSRRLAHIEIRSGAVLIDGNPTKNVGLQIEPEQVISLNGENIKPAQHIYLMLNKPEGTICANSDPQHPTVIDLLGDAAEAQHPTEPLQIVGRLDIDTTGLVLITTDGQWNHKITAPNSQCGKTYSVTLAEPISKSAIEKLEAGITLKSEKKPTLPCKITLIDELTVTIQLQEGKYHQVKRMFAAVGNKVTQLHRERIANIELPSDLAPGDFRPLTEAEINLQ